jgi:hypothetical protein
MVKSMLFKLRGKKKYQTIFQSKGLHFVFPPVMNEIHGSASLAKNRQTVFWIFAILLGLHPLLL